jgi:hypothetical protein
LYGQDCGCDRYGESGHGLHNWQQEAGNCEEREKHRVRHPDGTQTAMGACDRYTEHDCRDDEQQGRA